jgi:hypothetical protein
MDPFVVEQIAPMIMGIVFTVVVGAVILLKPISNKLGHLLEAMAKEKSEPRAVEELGHIRELLETMNGRLSLMEERQDFTEQLLADPERRAMRLKSGGGAGPSEGP